jgi:hypothetical protein
MRFQLIRWLILTLTPGGCIETDRSILSRQRSESPQILTGLWSDNFLFKPLDQHSLRASMAEKGERKRSCRPD